MISDVRYSGDHTFIALSDRGIDHQHNHIPNQDAAMFELLGEDFVIAVSDGVGTCKKAEIGSRKAVEAVRSVFFRIKGSSLRFQVKTLAKMIIDRWMELLPEKEIDDHCATLKTVFKIDESLFLLSIGDGLLMVTSDGTSMAAPGQDNLFSNQTACLNKKTRTEDFWSDEFTLRDLKPYVIFLCTDGVANSIAEGRELEFVHELETNIKAMALKKELEDFVENISHYSGDDRTIGMVKYERHNAGNDRQDHSHTGGGKIQTRQTSRIRLPGRGI